MFRVWSMWWWVTKTWVTSVGRQAVSGQGVGEQGRVGEDPGVDHDHQVAVADQADGGVHGRVTGVGLLDVTGDEDVDGCHGHSPM